MTEPRPMFGDPIGPWHPWFAWLPVRSYDHRLAWMRFVSRRRIQLHHYLTGGPDQWWQYSIERRHP